MDPTRLANLAISLFGKPILEVQVVLLRRYEDRAVEALSCSGQAVQKVRLDFGWEGALAGEGIEGVDMQWNALCYDITVSILSLHIITIPALCCLV